MNRFLISIAASLGCAAAAAAQDSVSFADLQGAWSGSGRFQGLPSTVDATFQPALGGSFWRLTYAVEAASDDGPVRFAGEGLYPAAMTATAEGRWFDVRGAALPTRPRFDGGALVVEWTEGDTAGRSTYAPDDDGLRVTDAVIVDGEAEIFAQAELRRVRTPADLVDELYAAFNRHDLDAMWALYDEDARHVSPTDPSGWSGEEKFREVYGGLFDSLPGLRDDVVSVVVDGDRAAIEFVASWDGPDGRIELPIAGFLTIRNGRIVEDVTYYDN